MRTTSILHAVANILIVVNNFDKFCFVEFVLIQNVSSHPANVDMCVRKKKLACVDYTVRKKDAPILNWKGFCIM